MAKPNCQRCKGRGWIVIDHEGEPCPECHAPKEEPGKLRADNAVQPGLYGDTYAAEPIPGTKKAKPKDEQLMLFSTEGCSGQNDFMGES